MELPFPIVDGGLGERSIPVSRKMKFPFEKWCALVLVLSVSKIDRSRL